VCAGFGGLGPPPRTVMTSSKGTPIERAWWTAGPFLRGFSQARFPYRSPDVIRRAQVRRLRAAVAHAYRHVPHYREAMRRLALDPSGTESDRQRDPGRGHVVLL